MVRSNLKISFVKEEIKMSRKADDIRRQKELENSASTAVKAKESPKTDDEFAAAVDEYLKKQGFVEKVSACEKKVESNTNEIKELKKKVDDISTTVSKTEETLDSLASGKSLTKSVQGAEALPTSITIQRVIKAKFVAGNYSSENKIAVEQASGKKADIKYIWDDSKEVLSADDLERLDIVEKIQG